MVALPYNKAEETRVIEVTEVIPEVIPLPWWVLVAVLGGGLILFGGIVLYYKR